MSAESPRKSYRSGGSTVRPQPATDKTVIESVVDFIQDVVPAYGNTAQKTDDREKIHWVQFQQADINSIHTNPDYDVQSGIVPPLLLLIGYTNGVQIWAIPVSGEAQEVMSVRQGPVRFLKVMPTPLTVPGCPDLFACKRPLLAVCDASSAGQPYCNVKFLSLRTGDEVHNITFKLPVTDIQCNQRVVVVAFAEKIAAFDAFDLREKFCVTSCYPCPGPNPNPIALGTRWLAYADKKLVPVHQSCGGMTGDGRQSYAATVISAAKTITKGLTIFGETVASSLTGMKSFPTPAQKEAVDNEGCRPGVVTIIDIENAGKGQISVQDDLDGEGLIAHFPAHATEPVAAIKFDPSGTMVLTTDRLGHNFHLFRLMAHPWSCSLGAVHHLYTLHRGDTTAKVQDICFTLDSRWVAITTLHGTTHVFPITPYGGSVNVRTHTSQRVVNRASRFHRSAGLDDIDTRLTDRDSPVPVSGSPGSSPGQHPDQLRHLLHQNAINNSMGNPRLPPYPHPTTSLPLVQIKQTLSIPGLGVPGTRTGMTSKSKTSLAPPGGVAESVCVAVCFAPSRGWVAGSPNMTREKSDKRAVDSLFVISWTGSLIEYVLEPHMKSGTEKATDDSQLDVMATARAQWCLIRCMSTNELKPPLSPNNALVLATDAVLTQRPSAELMGTLARQESRESLSSDHSSSRDDQDDQWLSQVEIITHSGPHRRLWMGPQFSFKTFQGSNTTTVLSSNSSVLLSHSPDTHICAMDNVNEDIDLQSLKIAPSRSSPVAMPGGKRPHRLSSGSDVQCRSPVPEALLIEAGSYEQSPSLMEAYVSWPEAVSPMPGAEHADDRLREHLADAMIESPVKTPSHSASHHDVEQGSSDNLSSSCGSGSSASRSHSFNAHPSPPRSIEHVLVFPTGNDSS